ncbi:hypothetical protein OsccyDRAFT_0636 [Leptolyngbyaceae cyanobacterium JSC-12]|nr:hypothetical protein OsccyDRAFT_0636 [Leptolyngbyaceae cyanobacterium JSC-12]
MIDMTLTSEDLLWYNPVKIGKAENKISEESSDNNANLSQENVLIGITGKVKPRYSLALKICRAIISKNQPEEISQYGDDAVMLSIHAVFNKVDFRDVFNKYARARRNRFCFYLQFNVVATDIVEEFTTVFDNGQEFTRYSVTRANIVSPTYTTPVTLVCKDLKKSVFKASVGSVSQLYNPAGVPRYLKGGRGEPLFTPGDLLLHSSKIWTNKVEPETHTKVKPMLVREEIIDQTAAENLVIVG